MGCPARARNDHSQAALARRFSVLEEQIRSAKRTHDPRLVRNFKGAQYFYGRSQHLVVALAAHYHAHQGLLAHRHDYTSVPAAKFNANPCSRGATDCASSTRSLNAGAMFAEPPQSPRIKRSRRPENPWHAASSV